MALHFGPAASALCANAQSANTARLVFIEFPLRAALPGATTTNKPRAESRHANSFQISVVQLCERRAVGAPAIKGARPKGRKMLTSIARYFFLPEPKVGCHPAVFWLGAAAMVLIFSFFGFLVSRLPFCSPLAMSISLWSLLMTP